jgi:hypothetical protein
VREEHRLRVFHSRTKRKKFGSKKDVVTVEWRRLHIEELHDLDSSQNIFQVLKSRRMRLARHMAHMGRRGAYSVSVQKPEGKKSLGEPKGRWEDNIKMGLQEVGWGIDWIDQAHDSDMWRACVNAVMNH